MLILGLNMFQADDSAAIVHDGKIVFAVAEERLNRHKHYGGFPALAVRACLNAVGAKITDIDHNASSIYGCRAGQSLFFTTMVEPSTINTDCEVHLVGSRDGAHWEIIARWKKDGLSMKYFQYGNAFLPDGENTTNLLAATTAAVEQDDGTTTLWQVR